MFSSLYFLSVTCVQVFSLVDIAYAVMEWLIYGIRSIALDIYLTPGAEEPPGIGHGNVITSM